MLTAGMRGIIVVEGINYDIFVRTEPLMDILAGDLFKVVMLDNSFIISEALGMNCARIWCREWFAHRDILEEPGQEHRYGGATNNGRGEWKNGSRTLNGQGLPEELLGPIFEWVRARW